MTPRPMDFGGPMGFRKAAGFSGITLRNHYVRPEDFFIYFGDHLILTKKNVRILVKTFFFVDHLILTEKTVRILVKTFFFEITS